MTSHPRALLIGCVIVLSLVITNQLFLSHQVAAPAVLPTAVNVLQAVCARARPAIPAVVSEAWCITVTMQSFPTKLVVPS